MATNLSSGNIGVKNKSFIAQKSAISPSKTYSTAAALSGNQEAVESVKFYRTPSGSVMYSTGWTKAPAGSTEITGEEYQKSISNPVFTTSTTPATSTAVIQGNTAQTPLRVSPGFEKKLLDSRRSFYGVPVSVKGEPTNQVESTQFVKVDKTGSIQKSFITLSGMPQSPTQQNTSQASGEIHAIESKSWLNKTIPENLETLGSRLEMTEARSSGFKKTAATLGVFGVNVGIGIGKSVTALIHPIDTAKGIFNSVIHFPQTAALIGSSLQERPAATAGQITGIFIGGKIIGKITQTATTAAAKATGSAEPKVAGFKTGTISTLSSKKSGVTASRHTIIEGKALYKGIFGRTKVAKIKGVGTEQESPAVNQVARSQGISRLSGEAKLTIKIGGSKYTATKLTEGASKRSGTISQTERLGTSIVKQVGKRSGKGQITSEAIISERTGDTITSLGSNKLLKSYIGSKPKGMNFEQFSKASKAKAPETIIGGRSIIWQRGTILESSDLTITRELSKGIGYWGEAKSFFKGYNPFKAAKREFMKPPEIQSGTTGVISSGSSSPSMKTILAAPNSNLDISLQSSSMQIVKQLAKTDISRESLKVGQIAGTTAQIATLGAGLGNIGRLKQSTDTALSSRSGTTFIGVPSSIQTIKTNSSSTTKVSQSMRNIQLTKPLTKLSSSTAQESISRQIVSTKQLQLQKTAPATPKISIGQTGTGFPVSSLLSSQSFGSFLGGSKLKFKQPKGYTPSVFSAVTGFRGKPSKAGIKTGLDIRPIKI